MRKDRITPSASVAARAMGVGTSSKTVMLCDIAMGPVLASTVMAKLW